MWVVYKKKERKIIGLTPNCDIDLDKETAIAEIVAGSRDPGDIGEYDALQVTDMGMASQYMRAFPERLVIAGTAAKPKLSIRDPEINSLYITTNATSRHPVDGIPEIPADGKSSLLLTIQKMDVRAKPLAGPEDNDQLYFRTDHGVVRSASGKEDIHGIRLKRGKAGIRLFSDTVKRV
ncbi:MAG TPA: hypothetical protein VF799_04925, partial [Geobacteraceae bacterium]